MIFRENVDKKVVCILLNKLTIYILLKVSKIHVLLLKVKNKSDVLEFFYL